MLTMANLPDFAKHREKRNFAQMFINSANGNSAKNRINGYQADLSAMQREGVAMASTVPVESVKSMFTCLK
jgi:hypothetical protein